MKPISIFFVKQTEERQTGSPVEVPPELKNCIHLLDKQLQLIAKWLQLTGIGLQLIDI